MLDLQHLPLLKGVMVMTEAETCENVLGYWSRYVKGLGFGPKLASTFKSRHTTSRHEVDLDNYETQPLMETQQKT